MNKKCTASLKANLARTSDTFEEIIGTTIGDFKLTLIRICRSLWSALRLLPHYCGLLLPYLPNKQ